jgi:hypothetical protein
MSHGPGIWQRKILAAVQHEGIVPLHTLLPASYTTAQRLACNRAAHRLAARGLIALADTGRAMHQGHLRLVVASPGTPMDYWTLHAWYWRKGQPWWDPSMITLSNLTQGDLPE